MSATWLQELKEGPASSTNTYFKTFNVGEWVQTTMFRHRCDPDWEKHKQLGNEAYQKEDFHAAITHFSDGLVIALGVLDGGMLHTFRDALESHPEDSPQGRFISLSQAEPRLFAVILQHLFVTQRAYEVPCGPGRTMERMVPNLPAAICVANRSAAHLKIGKCKEALGRPGKTRKCKTQP